MDIGKKSKNGVNSLFYLFFSLFFSNRTHPKTYMGIHFNLELRNKRLKFIICKILD